MRVPPFAKDAVCRRLLNEVGAVAIRFIFSTFPAFNGFALRRSLQSAGRFARFKTFICGGRLRYFRRLTLFSSRPRLEPRALGFSASWLAHGVSSVPMPLAMLLSPVSAEGRDLAVAIGWKAVAGFCDAGARCSADCCCCRGAPRADSRSRQRGRVVDGHYLALMRFEGAIRRRCYRSIFAF